MTAARSPRNKHRGAQDERDVARILGGKRHLADTGGPEDVEHDWLAIQVKGGATVTTAPLRDGIVAAKLAALGKNKLPVCVLVDRRGTRLARYVVIELGDFAAWFGLPKEEEAK